MVGFLRTSSLQAIAIAAAVLGGMALASPLATPAVEAAPASTSFKKQVLPIFERHRVVCHSPSGVGYKAIGLDLRSYQGVMAGSFFGVAVIPRRPELSPLISVLGNGELAFKNLVMPPVGKPLSSADVETIRRWIKEGAPDN